LETDHGTSASHPAVEEHTFTEGFRLIAWLFGVMMIVSAAQLIPSAALPRSVHVEASAMAPLWPQGWKFYADQPFAPEAVAYRINPDGSFSSVNFLQLSRTTYWGLNRDEPAQFFELSTIRAAIPKQSWVSCAGIGRDECFRAVLREAPIGYRNYAVDPTVCGRVVLVLEQPDVRLDHRDASMTTRLIVRGANLAATCV